MNIFKCKYLSLTLLFVYVTIHKTTKNLIKTITIVINIPMSIVTYYRNISHYRYYRSALVTILVYFMSSYYVSYFTITVYTSLVSSLYICTHVAYSNSSFKLFIQALCHLYTYVAYSLSISSWLSIQVSVLCTLWFIQK